MFDWDFDIEGWVMGMMPNIHKNKNLPQDIRDSWINLAMEINVKHLHDGEEEYIEEIGIVP